MRKPTAKPNPTTNHQLTQKQLHILKLTYKFRFITAPLLAKYKNLQSRQSMFNALERLVEKEYLAKRITKNNDFSNKGAQYYLTPKAFKVLRDEGIDQRILHAMYKNKAVTQAFVDRTVMIFSIYLSLRSTYQDTFEMFTKSETITFDDLPDVKPDLYLSRNDPVAGKPSDYFMELVHDIPLYLIKKRFTALIEHFEESDWAEEEYPALLFVLADGQAEKRFQEYCEKTLDATGIESLRVYTTSTKALITTHSEFKIWTDVVEPQMLLGL